MFALIVGVDKYKSGSVWDLDSCVSDARRVSRWLSHDLGVPKVNICMLLDEEATLQNIQAAFVSHLVQNEAIHRGDAILVYFAGHGSLIRAPPDWPLGQTATRDIQVLCPYDHDTKTTQGRVAGFSDVSLKALLKALSLAKGNNVTVAVDSCFSPPSNIRHRRHIRFTPTQKAKSEDLRSSLWRGAADTVLPDDTAGFYSAKITSHILLAACGPNERAAEGKDGGRFTSAFLEAARATQLRKASYDTFMASVISMMGDGQRPMGIGNTSRFVFDSAPFLPNAAYRAVTVHDEKHFRVEGGSMHGIEKGHELSIHSHNFSGEKNPPIASVIVSEIHPTWCLVHRKSLNTLTIPSECWALRKPTTTLSRSSTIISVRSTSFFQRICAALRRWKLSICGSSDATTETVNQSGTFTEKRVTEEPQPMILGESRTFKEIS